MPYPYPPTNATTLIDIVNYVNTDILKGAWAILFVFVIFIVAFIGFGQHWKEEAFTASALIAFVSSLLLRTIGLLNDWWMFLWLIILALSVVMLHKRQ